MSITWIHIPADRDKMLPEQWQARAGVPEQSVAVLRRAETRCVAVSYVEWQAVLTGTQEDFTSVIMTGVTMDAVKSEIEDTLEVLGWRR